IPTNHWNSSSLIITPVLLDAVGRCAAVGRPWCFVTPVQALAVDVAARLPTGRAPRRTRTRRVSSLGVCSRWDLLGTPARVAERDDESTERARFEVLIAVGFNGTGTYSAYSRSLVSLEMRAPLVNRRSRIRCRGSSRTSRFAR